MSGDGAKLPHAAAKRNPFPNYNPQAISLPFYIGREYLVWGVRNVIPIIENQLEREMETSMETC